MHDLFIFDEECGYDEIPIWWQNFLKFHRHGYNGLLSADELNTILEPLNAKFYTTKTIYMGYGDRYLRFEHEADISLFILRWS